MIYLDNAATSFPKPRSVTEEQMMCMKHYCGNPGRGSHALALAAAEKVFECRERISDLLGGFGAESVAFTLNTTAALNTVIKGLLRQGDHVLLSDMEHNATFRPVWKLAEEEIVTYDLFPTYAAVSGANAEDIRRGILRLLRPNTRMLICAHASNICSAALPLEVIGEVCRENGILFVVDAAQSAGHLPIDMKKMHIDALCAPGHKGLLGPQGCGFFLLRKGLDAETLIEGGSGYRSLIPEMPHEMPERYEAGTLPTPAIAGLCEGIAEVTRRGVEAIHAHERAWSLALQERLAELPQVKLYTPHHIGSVLLFSIDGIPSERVCQAFSSRGICVRGGFHCAALAHATLQTPKDGAVRISPGIYSTKADADAVLQAVRELIRRS